MLIRLNSYNRPCAVAEIRDSHLNIAPGVMLPAQTSIVCIIIIIIIINEW